MKELYHHFYFVIEQNKKYHRLIRWYDLHNKWNNELFCGFNPGTVSIASAEG